MDIKLSIWEKLPPTYQETELWFLFKKSSFYQFQYVRDLLSALNLLLTRTESPIPRTSFFLDDKGEIIENKGEINIFYAHKIENGVKIVSPYLLLGEGLRAAYIYPDVVVIRYELSAEEQSIPTAEVFALLQLWLKLLKNDALIQLKEQVGIVQKAQIRKLKNEPNPKEAEKLKFALLVLERLQVCDTAQEFDILQHMVAILPTDSELTKKLLALIKAKRDLYQI